MIVETLDSFGMLPKFPCLPTLEQEIFLNWCCEDWTMDPMTGIVDVNGTFNCAETKTTDFCGLVFGTVGGDFNCRHNPLRSLSGSPRIVRGDFDCRYVQLQDLIGSPLEVNGRFHVTTSYIDSYLGAPPRIDGGLWVRNVYGIPWNLKGWLNLLSSLTTGTVPFEMEIGRILIGSVLQPESIDHMIRRDDNHMLKMVAEVWDRPDFADLKSRLKLPSYWDDALMLLLLREKEIQGFF
jgi:hypothetical protein